jgi:hypothetical protein
MYYDVYGLVADIENRGAVRHGDLSEECQEYLEENYDYNAFDTFICFTGRFGIAYTTLNQIIDPNNKLNGVHMAQHIIYQYPLGLELLIHIDNISDKKRRKTIIKGLTDIGHGEYFKDKMKFIKDYFNMDSCDFKGF